MKRFWENYGKIAVIALAIAIVIGLMVDIFNPAYGQ